MSSPVRSSLPLDLAAARAGERGPVAPVLTGERGVTLVELIVFIVIVAVGLSGVLAVFLPATAASADPMQRRQALAIAESLLEEVSLMPFTWCDPDDANVASAASAAGCASLVQGIGPTSGETRFGAANFDNVGDYAGYSMSGIVDIANRAVPGLAGYGARVAVATTALGSISAASGDALRITVTVTAPDGSSIVLDGVRTRQAPNAAF
jgi:MSHA pilin protein MshD